MIPSLTAVRPLLCAQAGEKNCQTALNTAQSYMPAGVTGCENTALACKGAGQVRLKQLAADFSWNHFRTDQIEGMSPGGSRQEGLL